jgi:hypothetical protein
MQNDAVGHETDEIAEFATSIPFVWAHELPSYLQAKFPWSTATQKLVLAHDTPTNPLGVIPACSDQLVPL